MAQVKIERSMGSAAPIATLRGKLRDGIKWWAEHQAWPATDEIRVEPRRERCC